jgi:hypothetical protein
MPRTRVLFACSIGAAGIIAAWFFLRDSGDGLTVLKRAIAAHGGDENSKRAQRGFVRTKAEGQSPPTGRPFTADVTAVFDLPNRYHRHAIETFGTERRETDFWVRGGQAWYRRDGKTEEYPPRRHLRLRFGTLSSQV